MHMSYARLLLATTACALATGVLAQETTTYTYDALGRLVATSHAGGANNGLQTGISYDPAGNRSNYSVSGGGSQPTLSISNASVTEGGALVFTVTKAGGGAASANWASANGSATAGSDYTAASGTISFASGETSKTISITTIDDAAVESAETMTVTLSNPSAGAAIGTATGTGTINDNDTAANNPPVANPNTLSAPRCSARTVNVIANDTDPDGDYPLTLISVNQWWAYVANGTTVGMDTPSTNGTYVITYTVQDSRGATANGSLTVTVSGTNACD